MQFLTFKLTVALFSQAAALLLNSVTVNQKFSPKNYLEILNYILFMQAFNVIFYLRKVNQLNAKDQNLLQFGRIFVNRFPFIFNENFPKVTCI